MVGLRDMNADSLRLISPDALSAYAEAEGWVKSGEYRRYSDIYSADGKPEILVPRVTVIDDYAMSVSDLIRTFARQAGRDEAAVYYDLTVADRDVIRVSVDGDGSEILSVASGVALLNRSRDMVFAAACSLGNSLPVYRVDSNSAASAYLKEVKMSHIETGSSVLVLQSPVVPPEEWNASLEAPFKRRSASLSSLSEQGLAPPDIEVDSPMARRVTERLHGSLTAARDAAEQVAVGESGVFDSVVRAGVSANLCEAVAGLLDGAAPFQVGFTFAKTRPSALNYTKVSFDMSHAEILKEAARNFRAAAPVYGARLFGFVHGLERREPQVSGMVRVRADVGGGVRSVSAELNADDYDRAVEAHRTNASVIMEGDLERAGRRWRLCNARLVEMGDRAYDGEDY